MNILKRYKLTAAILLHMLILSTASAQYLLVPMEETQTNHLKAYGLTYWALEVPREYQCYWWLNYRGGAFVVPDSPDVKARAAQMRVSYEQMSVAEYQTIKETIIATSNMDEILLEKAPKIAVYAPPEDTLYRDPLGRCRKNSIRLRRNTL